MGMQLQMPRQHDNARLMHMAPHAPMDQVFAADQATHDAAVLHSPALQHLLHLHTRPHMVWAEREQSESAGLQVTWHARGVQDSHRQLLTSAGQLLHLDVVSRVSIAMGRHGSG